jgi:hypothetical protein
VHHRSVMMCSSLLLLLTTFSWLESNVFEWIDAYDLQRIPHIQPATSEVVAILRTSGIVGVPRFERTCLPAVAPRSVTAIVRRTKEWVSPQQVRVIRIQHSTSDL